MPNLVGDSNNPNVAAVFGEHTAGAAAVIGQSNNGRGVLGISETGQGVWGASVSSYGVAGVSKTGPGGRFESEAGRGVEGGSIELEGISGSSTKGDGVFGGSDQGAGVHGRGATGGGFEGSVAGITAKGGGDVRDLAGFFNGNVEVVKTVKTFDVFILGSDCAEDFDVTSWAHVEPGTVMVIGDDARLVESRRAYDKRVAGIISGAADYKPGIVLGKDVSRKDRVPLALIGKVFCKVDATYAPIKVGDLLTTSPTEGHAMKAEDPLKAFGAVVGKALAPLSEGRSLLPILVALQ
jgi:hypothetical protein